MKSLVYDKRSNSRTQLIRSEMTKKVMGPVMSTVGRAQMCVDSQVGHFENKRRT